MRRSVTCLVMVLCVMLPLSAPAADRVTITDQGSYYQVSVEANDASPQEVWSEYGRAVLAAVPDYESLVDSFLAAMVEGSQELMDTLIARTELIKPQVPEEYRQAIEAVASCLSGHGSSAVVGDGKLADGEFWVWNLISDVYRAPACSMVSVFGSRSATGSTITGRLMDWVNVQYTAPIQAITTIKNGEHSICLIGWLGMLGAVTAVNPQGVFCAVLEAGGDEANLCDAPHSYILDLRWALEHYTTLEEVAAYMTDTARTYPYGHLIALADANRTVVVENDVLTGTRQVRTADSSLRDGASWGFSEAIAAVNSFMLPGTTDTFTHTEDNRQRWNTFRDLMEEAGSPVGVDRLKDMVGFYDGDKPGDYSGDIYNAETQQAILFQPAEMSLQVFMHPRDQEDNPEQMSWETVEIGF